jgi:hypothetical protein
MFDMFNNLPRQAFQAANRVKQALKSTNITDAERKFLEKFDTREEFENLFL